MAAVSAAMVWIVAGALQASHAQEVLYEQRIPAEPLPFIVPANFAGKTIPMILDTGSAQNSVDTSLQPLLHHFVDETTDITIGAEVKVKRWKTPPAAIGKWKLPSSNVTPHDFGPVRRALGCDIQGLIGCEVFKGRAVEVNFDEGRFRVLKGYQPPSSATPLGPGESARGLKFVPLHEDEGGIASVLLNLDGVVVNAAVDTGSNSFLSLRTEIFDKLVNSGMIFRSPDSDNSTETTVGGSFQIREGVFTRGTSLGIDLRGIPVSDGLKLNNVGLSFLLRFNFVWDLSRDRFYFEPRHGQPAINPWGMIGATFTFPDGKCQVSGATSGSARKSGLQKGDILLRMQGVEGKDLNMYSLYHLCETCAGQTIEVEYTRSGKKGTVKTHLSLPGKKFIYEAEPAVPK